MTSVSSQLTFTAQTVTVIVREDGDPSSRFQVVAYGDSETAPRPIHACRTQGKVVSWLVSNGYKWVPDSHPQQWVKS